ncbi:MAG: glycosyltransferase [Lacunisphaera sp.]
MPANPAPGCADSRLSATPPRPARRAPAPPAMETQPPDLVHVATEGPLGASAITTARRMGIPVTSSFHTNFDQYTRDYRIGWFKPVVAAWLRHVHNRTLRTFVPTRDLLARSKAKATGTSACSRAAWTPNSSTRLAATWNCAPPGASSPTAWRCCTSAAWPRRKTIPCSSAPSTPSRPSNQGAPGPRRRRPAARPISAAATGRRVHRLLHRRQSRTALCVG